MATGGWLRGVVKEVPSGDTVVIAAGAAKPGAIPAEKRITLSSVIAPKLVRGLHAAATDRTCLSPRACRQPRAVDWQQESGNTLDRADGAGWDGDRGACLGWWV